MVRLDPAGHIAPAHHRARASRLASLDYLLEETPRLQTELVRLDGVHVVVDAETSTLPQIVEQIRSARPDMLS